MSFTYYFTPRKFVETGVRDLENMIRAAARLVPLTQMPGLHYCVCLDSPFATFKYDVSS